MNNSAYVKNTNQWIDPKGLAYFEYRPLAGGASDFGVAGNALDDKLNIMIAHEQLFFEDGKIPLNIGYMASSTLEVDDPKLLKTYITTPNRIHYNDCVMRKAVSQTTTGTYSLLGTLGVGNPKNNCQDWADRVRQKYRLLINNPLVKMECKL